MSKIIPVINTMISNSNKISNVRKNINEFFFLYDSKFKWSIRRMDNEVYLIHFYPSDKQDIKDLSTLSEWSDVELVTYSTEDIKTKEAIESFRELYQIVSSKIFGIDDIFDEILRG